MKQTYNRTLTACYTGYVVQAIVFSGICEAV